MNPTDRYTLSLPGSSEHRISPLDNTYDNLTMAGDWTDCGLNLGCVEAAVMSGRLAAHALSGSPGAGRNRWVRSSLSGGRTAENREAEMTDNRAKRDDPPRTRSNRTTSGPGRPAQSADGASAATPGAPPPPGRSLIGPSSSPTASSTIISPRARKPPSVSAREPTVRRISIRTSRCCSIARSSFRRSLARWGVDFFDAVRKMAGPRLGAPPVSDVAVEVKSKQRNQVKYDIRSSPTRFNPAVPPLYSADRTKEPLKDIHFDGRGRPASRAGRQHSGQPSLRRLQRSDR